MDLHVIDGGKGASEVAKANVDAAKSLVKRDYTGVPDDTLASAIFDAESLLAAADEMHRAKTAELRFEISDMRACLTNRMETNHAKVLAHDDLDATLEQRTKLDKRIDVLRELQGVVPADDLAKAMSVELSFSLPPDLVDSVQIAIGEYISLDKIKKSWKFDAVKAKPFRKLGDHVAAILDRGLVHVAIGKPILKIVEKQQAIRNVTPAPAIGGAE